ncbi:uncharacterized protein LOC128730412 [Anopheles nili]|uniref:uncharacterized protein LOC128730412 n=1 Tax=Anopheles nili TaxID=185578 RepID=UPI00237C0B6A|nr:uncharacterized protein LOC128730412 [Anopheles nili]
MLSKDYGQLLLVMYCGPALVVLLTLQTVSGTQGSPQYADVSSQRKAHYCGTKLSNTLAELCNRFNGFRKKSEHSVAHASEDVHGERLLDDVQNDVDELRMLHDRSGDMIYKTMMTLQHLNSNNQHFARVRRQVVAECCYQSCTLDTLKSYCAD